MRNIMCSVKLLYQIVYRCCFFMLLVIILIVIVLICRKIFVYFFCVKSNFNTPVLIKKYISYQFQDISDKKNCNNIIYDNILNKNFCIDKSMEKMTTYNYVVLQNDIINRVLIKNSKKINSSEVITLVQQYPILKELRAGQMLSWLVITNEHLKFLIWNFSSQEIRVYNRAYTDFSEGIIRIIDPLNNRMLNNILFIGTLNGTFIDSAHSLGVEENYILDIIHALRDRLNFKKLHQGDKFAIITSIMINDNNNIKTKFIGARLCSSEKSYYVFRANNGKFYDHKAVRLGNNFMRFPILKPFRISSNFNLHRLNPVTKQISPHAGVDFAVPVGTPVFTIGDGKVIVSAYSKIAGNYVVIEHNCRCITRYMHLNKLLVKIGQQVRCGEKIALSGNTGRSTGPHLHFEVWLDRRPVNPLTINLLNIEKLLGNDRAIYLNQIKKVISQLCFD